jgi:hypothetical protein
VVYRQLVTKKKRNEEILSNVEVIIITIRSGEDYLSLSEVKLPRLGVESIRARVCNKFGRE